MGERARQRDEYSEQEAQQRFEKLVKAALRTPPKPLKDIPLKWSGAKRRRPKKGVPAQSKKRRKRIA